MPQIIWTLIASWRYYRRAQTIYQIHSPLAYQLIELIRAKEQAYYAFTNISALKELALRDKTVINRMDFGTGKKNQSISIRRFAQKAIVKRLRGERYFRLVQWKKPHTILELGTALGFSTAYLASAARNARLHTLEGDPELVAYAKNLISKLELRNVDFHQGKIEDQLDSLSRQIAPIDVVLMDANHQYDATVAYFESIRPHLSKQAYIIVDDIRWSAGMYKAWQRMIQALDRVMAIEFYGWGLLILDAPIPRSVHLISIPTRWKPWTIRHSI